MIEFTVVNWKLSWRQPSHRWEFDPQSLPWFDQPYSESLCKQRHKQGYYTDEQFELLQHWIHQGYVIVKDPVSLSILDGMLSDLEAIWDADAAIPELQIEDLQMGNDGQTGPMKHSDLLKLPHDVREYLKQIRRWRIHGFYRFSKAAIEIFQNHRLIEVASLIFDSKAFPKYTINFLYGSEQSLHQDTCVFHVFPMNNVIGAWIACEDVCADAGPLILYAGSHKEKLFSAFNNYPQTNLRTCNKQTTLLYEQHLNGIKEKYRRVVYLPKKGEALLWHGMLIHGGETIRNKNLTRKSYVCHYMPDGVDKTNEVKGPFNW